MAVRGAWTCYRVSTVEPLRPRFVTCIEHLNVSFIFRKQSPEKNGSKGRIVSVSDSWRVAASWRRNVFIATGSFAASNLTRMDCCKALVIVLQQSEIARLLSVAKRALASKIWPK